MDIAALHARAFDGVVPWTGDVKPGYQVDFLGTMIDLRFWKLLGIDPASGGGGFQQTVIPTPASWAEGYFEALNWLEAARAASGRYVMMTLGGCFGYQAVGAYRALQAVNPMPCKLVIVEPEPSNMQFARKHLIDNGIEPGDHWLVQMAVSDSNEVAFFPIGAPGTGTHNCLSANLPDERRIYLGLAIKSGQTEEALESLLLRNSTGYSRDLAPGVPLQVEIKFVSAITICDLVAPFDRVDYIEADMQLSEIVAFPPFMAELNAKVRRVHIGTHGPEAHANMRELFASNGWKILFDFEPFQTHQTTLGSFKTNDGILTATNPLL